MGPIFRRVIADGHLTAAQLHDALERQRVAGGFSQQEVVATGMLTRTTFFALLAEHWGLPPRDLVRVPPDPSVLADIDLEVVAEQGWMPCEIDTDGQLVVATSVRPGEDLAASVEDHFLGRRVRFVACTERDLDDAVLAALPRQGGGAPGYGEVPPVVVRPAHWAAAVAASAVLLVISMLLPVDGLAVVVLVESGLFVVIAGLQLTRSLFELMGEDDPSDGKHDQPPARDEELPVYTVLVRVTPGPRAVSNALELLRGLDYPHPLLDGLLLIAADDARSDEDVRRASPPEWVRVARLPVADHARPVRACDAALVLARGRYVVAYEAGDRPDRDQLRRAAAAFAADLRRRMTATEQGVPSPLLGLRVARRSDPRGAAPFERLSAVDDALHIDRAIGDRPGGARTTDHTSTHFDIRLLRRHGGFALACSEHLGLDTGRDPRAPRIGALASTSVPTAAPHARQWLSNRSEALALALLRAGAGARALVRAAPGRRPRPLAVAGAFATPLMFVTYPLVVGGAILLVLRDPAPRSFAESVALLCLVGAVVVLATAVAVAAAILWRTHGPRAALGALALPAHWLLHATSAWSAVAAVLSRRTRAR